MREQLTENFYRDEFACKCGCGFDTVDYYLVSGVLQPLRDFLEKPITVTSGCRCLRYNSQVGGGARSQHLFARAADLVVEDIDPSIVQEWARDNDVPGIGHYDDFTHLDTRTNGPARWYG